MKLTYFKLFIVPLIFLLSSNNRVNSFEKAETFHSAFSLFIQVNDTTYFKKLTIAKKLFTKGDYSQSLEESLLIADNTKDINLKIQANKLIGETFENVNNYKKAILYLKKTLSLIKENKLKLETNAANTLKIESECLLKIGGLYSLIPKLDSAKVYLEKVLAINSFNKEVQLKKADANTNLSIIYFYNEKYKDLKKAKIHANKAIKIHKEFNDRQTLSADYSNLASIYMEENNLSKAKELYLKALEYIEGDNRLKAIKYREALFDNLGWTLYNMKNYTAYEYLDRSVIIRDSLNKIRLDEALEGIEIKYNKELGVKEAITKKHLAERNTWLVTAIGVSIILLLLVLVNYYKLRQRNLSLTLSENELVQYKKIEKIKIESQIKILNATIDGKESERKQIAETLHDNVSALLSSANLHIQASQKQFKGDVPIELKKTQEIIKDASQQVRNLSHDLVSSILLKFGLEYAVKNITEKYSNSMLQIYVDANNIKRYNQDFEIKIYNIIQELINNILKHSKATDAYVMLHEENKKLFISIKDNGKGFDKNNVKYKNSVGLNQIDARIEMLNGVFRINSKIGEGTEVNITVPLSKSITTNYV